MAKSNAAVAPAPAPAPQQEDYSASKRVCPISRQEFADKAKPISVVINGEQKAAGPKQFSTGSLGYYFTGKQTIMFGDTPVDCQVAATITIIGSKDAQ